MSRRAIVVAGGLVMLTVIGVAYLVLARSRVEADLEARADAAAREIEAFEQSSGGIPGSLPVPSSTDATPTSAAPTVTTVVTTDSPPSTTTEPTEPADPAVAAAIASLAEEGAIAFVHRAPGDEYARVGVRHDDGTRTLIDLHCVRVHLGGGVLTCLRPSGGLLGNSTFRAHAVDGDRLVSVFRSDTGTASRTRASTDGRLLAYTAFVEGHSYLDVGGFATETIVVDRDDDDDAWNLEDYDRPDDEYHDALDGQFWGVSFLTGTTDFLVTYASGDRMEIMRGDAASHAVVPLADDGTCPAVSPNAETVVFKRSAAMADGSTGFQLVAMDLATGAQRTLDETRSVDDQVEWLDDDTILYAVERDDSGASQPTYDIWRLDIEGGAPELFMPFADSPAVGRLG